jgi:Tfp pilus assembly protein PilX
MKATRNNRGVVLLMVIFVVALLAAIVVGMLQINTDEIQIMQNHMRGAEARAVAEAGLNDALAQLRTDATWDKGFAEKSFDGGTYTVTRDESKVTSLGTTSQGFTARIEADVTVEPAGPPHQVTIDRIRVNE